MSTNANLLNLITAAGGMLSEDSATFPNPFPKSEITNNYLIPLVQHNGMFVLGPEAKKFLQGQITCHIENVNATHYQLSAHCNAKGWAISLFYLLQISQENDAEYFMRLPTSMVHQAHQALTKYALFSKVSLTINQNWLSLGLVGPDVLKILHETFANDFLDLKPQEMVTLLFKQEKVIILREIGDLPRYQLFLPDTLFAFCWEQLKPQTTLLSSSFWDLCDVRMGIPNIYPQTSEMALAPYLNLEALHAISFDKGCYVGQEVIARMHYRGKTKKHMYRAQIETIAPPSPGMELITSEGEVKGFVVRAAPAKPDNYEMLVILDDEFSSFENIFLFSPEKPKLNRLELPYKVSY